MNGSVTIAWGFEDETDGYAAAIPRHMPDLRACVPSLWPVEVANALLVGERRRRITPADRSRFLGILGLFPISIDDQTVAHAWAGTMNLVIDHRLMSYDASYLDLAIRLGLPPATLDARLKKAAHAIGVPHFVLA